MGRERELGKICSRGEQKLNPLPNISFERTPTRSNKALALPPLNVENLIPS